MDISEEIKRLEEINNTLSITLKEFSIAHVDVEDKKEFYPKTIKQMGQQIKRFIIVVLIITSISLILDIVQLL